ncbi:MAG: hypothetical protein Q4B05_00015 [Candidatus Saccharibacteria bacterium]|nr:hypothetical protein [Candidatus Saccharibacteria bacterium]
MKVIAQKTHNDFYTLREGAAYEVVAVIHFVTPLFETASAGECCPSHFVNPLYSHGHLPHQSVYIIKTKTMAGRTAFARFLTSDFIIGDPTVPDDWSVGEIDIADELERIRQHIVGDTVDEIIRRHRNANSRIIVFGPGSLHEPQRLYDICEDNDEAA